MIAFDSQGPLLNFTAATSAPTSVQAVTLDNVENQQYMLTNTSNSVDAVIGWGATDALAKTAAAAGATVQNCTYLLARSQVVITGSTGAFFSGITASSTAIVYVQAGYGM